MNRQRPRLKNGVDLQVQAAFADGNWSSVVRLAEKRARTLNDQYYEILKICAESQLDDPNAKLAAASAVWQYSKDGTVVKDVEAIDLLEWASLDLIHEDEYLTTLGPLRVRAVKAAPKDRTASFRSLESCLIHWDLSSAQQIAATMDKSFPQERRCFFWNIAIMHLLSTNPQTPPDKKKLYGTLAQKQLERAAQAAEQAALASPDEAAKRTARYVQTEEEIILLYEIVEKHGSAQDFEKLVASSLFSPHVQFKLGRKEIFFRAITKYQRDGNWHAVFRLCKNQLSSQDNDGALNILAADWTIWDVFLLAASHIKEVDASVAKTVQDTLLRFANSPGLPAIYRRNIILARVTAAFRLIPNETADVTNGRPSSLRLQELLGYVQDQATSPACFDDVKAVVNELDPSALIYLAHDFVPKLAQDAQVESGRRRIELLALKFRYFAATAPQLRGTSGSESFGIICEETLEQYKIARGDEENDHGVSSELAMLYAFCCVRLAWPNPLKVHHTTSLSSVRQLIRATLLLESQLVFTPKNSQLLLLLVQLHLRIGTAPRARALWEGLGVKRTIMDSLAPLFYDRLSLVSPALISPLDHWGWQLVDMLTSHFSNSLKIRMPRRLIDAFEAESYGSIVSIPHYITDLRSSSTRVMSLVEEARSERLIGNASWELLLDPRYTEVTDDLNLKCSLDYGSFPAWDHSYLPPICALLRLGPPPSNRRAHLSLLTEAFHDVLGYKSPTAYKIPAASSSSDHVFVLESLFRISNSLGKFLAGPNSDLTPSEKIYYDAVHLLSTLVCLCAGGPGTELDDSFGQLSAALGAALRSVRVPNSANGESSFHKSMPALQSMIEVGLYRETACAILLAVRWVVHFNQREKERDRSGKSSLPKDIVLGLQELQTAAEHALKEGKQQVTDLRALLSSHGDFQKQFQGWLFGEDDGICNFLAQNAVSDLVAHWRENIDGWQQVKWE